MRVLELRKEVQGEKHPSALTSMANLGHTFKAQGESQRALDLTTCCVSLPILSLGDVHPDFIDRARQVEDWSHS